MSFKTWMNQNKVKMLAGMEYQLSKYPEGDPRRVPLQKRIDKFRSGIDWTEGNDGSDNI